MRNNCNFFLLLLVAGCILILVAGTVQASSPSLLLPTPQPTATPHVATAEEYQHAYLAWAQSAHASTYDNGMGANTTCASCKSPRNWDPASLAVDAALDCGSCKRAPGAARPELSGGTPVAEADWKNIGCEICHQPAGDSVMTSIAFWDQATQKYDPVTNASEICAKCHEGQHGFEVVEEQNVSGAHQGWDCTQCHGPHGSPAACKDCHDPQQVSEAPVHAQHPSVDCTACHDAGGLTIWQDPDPTSIHYGQYITRRFAHTLASWPSHNLSKSVDCIKCHHPLGLEEASIVSFVSCEDCHPDGAVLTWCVYIPRDKDPNAVQLDSSGGK